MLNPILSPSQQETLREERRVIQRLLALLAGWEAQPKDVEVLQQALGQLDELFLLVIVGEFNSGKSALINALLGERYLTEGVTPTTAQIHIVRYGPKADPQASQEGFWVLTYPAEFLHNLSIVDTPGTNAVLREHEEISRDFVPRSDLIIFATSADRPFSESEREFLQLIRDWGKKVVIVINKIDLLETEQELETVVRFVRDNATRLLGRSPEIFPLSARQTLRAKMTPHSENGSKPEVPAEFRALEQFLTATLNQTERVRIKLRSPLGVAIKVAQEYTNKAQRRLELLNDDMTTVQQVEHQLDLYRRDMAQEFESHLLRVDRVLDNMEERGDKFFDKTLQVSNITNLANKNAIRTSFEREVLEGTPELIERQVQEMADWMVERESRQWRTMARQLGQRHKTELLEGAAHEAAGGFEYNRRQLLQHVNSVAAEVVGRYDRSAESHALAETARGAFNTAMITGLTAGLGGAALVAMLSTALLDVTGVLAATALAVAGLGIIPYRRRAVKQDLRQKVAVMKEQLHTVLHEAFQQELDKSIRRLNDAVDPYSRFVRTESKHLNDIVTSLATLEGDLERLRAALE
jgi:small GTP-binding protein